MNKKNISKLMFLILISSMSVACNKIESKDEVSVENLTDSKDTNKEIETLALDKKEFKDFKELKSFSETKIKEFENILKNNKIEYFSAEDSSLIINKHMTYEKYTKNFNQLAYTQISNDYERASGYLKTGLKLNVHLQEEVSIENNFIKAMYDVVKLYNPNIDEKSFNKEIKNATSSADDLSDKTIETGVDGIVIKVYSNVSTNEREIVLSLRQELQLPELKQITKEYKTVQEFKDDSEKLALSIKEKVDSLNITLNNSYIGKFKELSVKIKKFDVNFSSDFYQGVELEYTGVAINGLQEEMLIAFYETMEEILKKDNLANVITLNEFKAYLKGLEIYSGAYTGGILVDELGYTIEPNKLPFLTEVGLSMSYLPYTNNTVGEINNDMNAFDSVIKFTINVPVKAEGITNL